MISWYRQERVQEATDPAILQHLWEKGDREHQKYHLNSQPHTSLDAMEIVRRDVYASGAVGHNRHVKSHSHKRNRFDGGEGVDEIHVVEVCIKVDNLVIKPTQHRLQHPQPVTACCSGRPRLELPRHGLTCAELLGNHCPAQPACPSTPKGPLVMLG